MIQRAPALNFLAAAVVAVVASAAIGLAAPLAPTSGAALWLTVLWLGWTVTAIWTLTRPNFSLPMAAVTIVMLMFVILPATGDIASGQTTIAGNDYTSGTEAALRISALAQWALFLGAVLARLIWPIEDVASIRMRLSAARLDRVAVISVIVGLMGVLLFAAAGGAQLSDFLAFSSQGGYNSFYASAAGTRSGYFIALQLTAGLVLIVVALRWTSTRPVRRWVPVLCVAAAALLLLGEGARAQFFTPLLAGGLIWLKTIQRKVPRRTVAIVAAAALLIVASVLGIARGAAGQRSITVQKVLAAPFGSGSDLFSPLAGLAETVPSQVPYLNGRSYAEIVVFPVPRSLWHGKPAGSIHVLTDRFDPNRAGIAFPEYGEMYANFGLVGVVVGSLFTGLLVEWFWIRLAATSSLRETLLVALAFAISLQLYIRGAISGELVIFGGLIIGALIICRRRSLTLEPDEAEGQSLVRRPTSVEAVAH